ncbi:Transposase and inactivated derivatives [Leminorella richardii]|uniref:Transposase and inactivated derivatives n=1 Tax=Leminorella richardii TaxID=158841 RepID=A0A2X4U9J8_9GAMM|nr:Transposase and inactivated derivatives [Leminorella richardii]
MLEGSIPFLDKKRLRQLRQPVCPFCNSNSEVRKHGLGNSGLQRYLCKNCRRTFQSRYYYHANYHDVSEKIDVLIGEGWSVRKISAHLKVSEETVYRRIRIQSSDESAK